MLTEEEAGDVKTTIAYRETFRRHRRLLTLPIVLAVFIAGWIALGSAKSYQSRASLWVDSPASADSSLGNQNPAVLPPSQQEQNVVTELLATRDFALAVGHNSALGRYLATHGSGGFGPSALLSALGGGGSVDSRIISAVSPSTVTTVVPGPQVLQINYSGPTAAVAQSTLRAIVAELQRDGARFSAQHSQAAIAYYRAQSKAASQRLSQARNQVSAYLAQHRGAGNGDPTLTALQTAEGLASTQLTQANDNLNAAAGADTGGGGSSIKVIDPASVPSGPASGKKKQLLAIFGGLFAGALISLLGVVALTPPKRTSWEDELGAEWAAGGGVDSVYDEPLSEPARVNGEATNGAPTAGNVGSRFARKRRFVRDRAGWSENDIS